MTAKEPEAKAPGNKVTLKANKNHLNTEEPYQQLWIFYNRRYIIYIEISHQNVMLQTGWDLKKYMEVWKYHSESGQEIVDLYLSTKLHTK